MPSALLHEHENKHTMPPRFPVIDGQMRASSNEVILNPSYCWECTKIRRTSGFGIVVVLCRESLLGSPRLRHCMAPSHELRAL